MVVPLRPADLALSSAGAGTLPPGPARALLILPTVPAPPLLTLAALLGEPLLTLPAAL